MPYKSNKMPIAGTEYDCRKKLTDTERETIRNLREEDGVSYARLAKTFGVSKQLVMFICNPDKYEVAKEQRRQRGKDGRYRQSKADQAATMKKHRQHKQYVYLLNQLYNNQNQ